MPKVAIQPTKPTTREAFSDLVARMDAAVERIRHRAYELFEARGEQPGNELEDWCQAERELFVAPAAELRDAGAELQLRLAVAGFTPEQLDVKVTPELIVVEGSAQTSKEVKKASTYINEFQERQLMRQFTLPVPVDPDRVKAHAEDGILTITAPKQELASAPAAAPRQIAAAAGR